MASNYFSRTLSATTNVQTLVINKDFNQLRVENTGSNPISVSFEQNTANDFVTIASGDALELDISVTDLFYKTTTGISTISVFGLI